MKKLVVITGPTAVGKTALTIAVAQHFNTEIINADSRQIYREMRIGTAAPTTAEQQLVRHYFVGTKSIHDYYNASMYEQDVLRLIGDNESGSGECSGNINILSGGSMMYIDAVCNGIDDIPTIREDIRQMLKSRYEAEGLEALCNDLQRLDPEHYEQVDRQNPRRVIHALEICLQTGKTYTSFRTMQRKPRPFDIVKIGLQRDRGELYDRINRRVDDMMNIGFLEEARSLYPYRHLNALNTVGYKELFCYLEGHWSLDEAVEHIKGNTRRYARKQLTWLRRSEDIRWFHPCDTDEILKYLSEL